MTDEPVEEEVPRPTRSRWRFALALVAVAGLAGVAAEAVVLNQVKASARETRQQLADAVAEIDDLRQELRDDLREARAVDEALVTAARNHDDRLLMVEYEVGDSFGIGGDLGSRVDDLESAVDQLDRCTDSIGNVLRGFSSYFFC